MNIQSYVRGIDEARACPITCGNVPCRLSSEAERAPSMVEHSGGRFSQAPYARRLALSASATVGLMGTERQLRVRPGAIDAPAYELRLQPGTALYTDAKDHDYVFLVIEGLVERRRMVSGPVPDTTVSFWGRGEVIAPTMLGANELETAVTTTWSDFLAVPCLMPDQASAARPLHMPATCRGSLRLAQALSHLLSISGMQSTPCFLDSMLPMHLPYDSLANWLGLDIDVLRAQASRLCRAGAVCSADDHLTAVFPRVLDSQIAASL